MNTYTGKPHRIRCFDNFPTAENVTMYGEKDFIPKQGWYKILDYSTPSAPFYGPRERGTDLDNAFAVLIKAENTESGSSELVPVWIIVGLIIQPPKLEDESIRMFFNTSNSSGMSDTMTNGQAKARRVILSAPYYHI